MLIRTILDRHFIVITIICSFLFLNNNVVQAQPSNFYTDLSSWEAEVHDIELLESIASNIALANEVTSVPGDHTDVGSILTFETVNTGLSKNFSVETLESDASFIFNEFYNGSVQSNYTNALSVGLGDSYENDDWRINLLGGAGIHAFGIVLRDQRFEAGESISLYYRGDLKNTIDLSFMTSTGNSNDFVGIKTDYLFDRIDFDENPGGDDIAIADLRFAAVAPEPISSTLFIVGGATLGFRRFRKKFIN